MKLTIETTYGELNQISAEKFHTKIVDTINKAAAESTKENQAPEKPKEEQKLNPGFHHRNFEMVLAVFIPNSDIQTLESYKVPFIDIQPNNPTEYTNAKVQSELASFGIEACILNTSPDERGNVMRLTGPVYLDGALVSKTIIGVSAEWLFYRYRCGWVAFPRDKVYTHAPFDVMMKEALFFRNRKEMSEWVGVCLKDSKKTNNGSPFGLQFKPIWSSRHPYPYSGPEDLGSLSLPVDGCSLPITASPVGSPTIFKPNYSEFVHGEKAFIFYSVEYFVAALAAKEADRLKEDQNQVPFGFGFFEKPEFVGVPNAAKFVTMAVLDELKAGGVSLYDSRFTCIPPTLLEQAECPELIEEYRVASSVIGVCGRYILRRYFGCWVALRFNGVWGKMSIVELMKEAVVLRTPNQLSKWVQIIRCAGQRDFI